MKKINDLAKRLWKDESAQGATEYILLLVIVVALALIFKERIKGLVGEKLDELGSAMGRVTAD